MLITPEELEERGRTLMAGGPLRLIFSGRLIAMKGADHLARVAARLKALGVPFQMTICGDGELAPRIKADINRLGLADVVTIDWAFSNFKPSLSRSPSTGPTCSSAATGRAIRRVRIWK